MERLTEKNGRYANLKACRYELCRAVCDRIYERYINCSHCPIQAAFDKLAEYEDFEDIFRKKMTDTACDFLSDKEEFGKWLDRNKWIAKKCDEWARAEKQGLLLRLPCKVGDKVWDEAFGVPSLYIITGFSFGTGEDYIDEPVSENEIVYYYSNHNGSITGSFAASEFGKTVFLTREEAEQKLKEMEENKDD